MCPLRGSAAGQPHCPRPRPRAAATAAVATAAAPSAAAAPDDDRAAILGALRQLRKGTRTRGLSARARRIPRSGIAPAPRTGRKRAAAPRGGGSGPSRWLRRQRKTAKGRSLASQSRRAGTTPSSPAVRSVAPLGGKQETPASQGQRVSLPGCPKVAPLG